MIKHNDFSSKDKLNIAMFTNNYLPFIGGVPLSIERIASELRKRGHKVYIFAPEYPNIYYEDHEDTFRCKLLKYIKSGSFYYAVSDIFSSRIENIFRNLDIDIVHVHHPYWMGKKGMKLAKKYNIPIVYTYHTLYEKYIEVIPYINERVGNLLSKYIVKKFCSDCDCILAPSESAKQCLANININTNVEVLPTGINLESYNNIDKKIIKQIRQKHLKDSELLLFSVSRLSKEKNLFFLLNGLRYIRNNTNVKFRCMIAGDGPEKKNIEKYIIKNGLEKEIELLGTIQPNEINKYYLASDIFVFSSTTETQGMVLVEAMAASLPVVAVSSSGTNDVIQNKINGFKTKEDVREWGDRIISLLENPNLLKEMSLNASNTAKSFSIELMGHQVLQIYGELLKNTSNMNMI